MAFPEQDGPGFGFPGLHDTSEQESPLFLRIIQRLLPDAAAWRIVVEKMLRRFFVGLANALAFPRSFIDGVYSDLFPSTTRELTAWEQQFGLIAGTTDESRRLQISGAWAATGGQSPRYLQDVMQQAGFPIYIHEWWESGPPWVARDPRLHTNIPLLSTTQCGEPLALCGEPEAYCNDFLSNDPSYLVNKTLWNVAPPPVPSDPSKWPYFLYWGAETFPNHASIDASRRAEFESLLLRICPSQQWLVELIDWVEP